MAATYLCLGHRVAASAVNVVISNCVTHVDATVTDKTMGTWMASHVQTAGPHVLQALDIY